MISLTGDVNDLESKNQEIYFEDAQCVRKRTQKGGVYGAMDPVVMTFSVRVNDQLHALRFFKAIASNQMTVMSFLFNAAYDERQRLKDFEDRMVVRGFVVGAEEVYKNEAAQDSQFQQMLVNIKLLVSTVTYMGYEDVNNLTGVFINNNVSDNDHAFGNDRVISEVNQAAQAGVLSPKALIERMTQVIQDFVDDAEQSDDLTILGIQYKKNCT